MFKLRYVYNPATLRYERARRSALSVGYYLTGLVLTGAAFFAGLVYLQNYFTETPLEKSLRAENKALQHYKVELAAQLESDKNQMSDLEFKDNSLYEKIFETKRSGEPTNREKRSNKEILLADVPGFHDMADEVSRKFADAHSSAIIRDEYFVSKAGVSREDLSFLTTVPSIAPIADFDAVKVVSGFGVRINPFHKGNYHHDGLDLAGPRGTEVLAAAPGRVTLVSHSDLQAGFGNYVEIDHGNGYTTRYANLGEIAVRFGQIVKKGQSLATIGISGGSVAPHVHYEVLKYGKNVDPVKFLVQGLDARQYQVVREISSKKNQSLD